MENSGGSRPRPLPPSEQEESIELELDEESDEKTSELKECEADPETLTLSTVTYYEAFDDIDPQGDEYLEAAKEGPESLLSLAPKEDKASKILGGALKEEVLRTSKHIVFAMEPFVLKALLEGNIARQYRSNAEVRNALDTLCAWARRVTQSSICVQTLVDKDGFSSTPAELFKVVWQLRNHCDLEEG
ncbi:hypothetical protein W97_01055 [Coniosporium apollinis CBS 100218]|uniref:Uncharacterized protein n=1 Tax=Coniosporium apollinis (strain CBS 100218) TaxID=1168221 RepID=R7YIT7_CONA1|nr:uncharacterized protein W97_01055 [Coniosporium apollinis CBS 100218]EON61837.1 hypothetical protein W97_01055 [Coniosporium apollinis CBS 100218]